MSERDLGTKRLSFDVFSVWQQPLTNGNQGEIDTVTAYRTEGLLTRSGMLARSQDGLVQRGSDGHHRRGQLGSGVQVCQPQEPGCA